MVCEFIEQPPKIISRSCRARALKSSLYCGLSFVRLLAIMRSSATTLHSPNHKLQYGKVFLKDKPLDLTILLTGWGKKIVTQCHECPTNKSGIEMPSFRPSHCEVPAKVSANLNEDPMLLCNIERVIWKFTSRIFEAAGRTVCEFICWSWPCLPTDSWP